MWPRSRKAFLDLPLICWDNPLPVPVNATYGAGKRHFQLLRSDCLIKNELTLAKFNILANVMASFQPKKNYFRRKLNRRHFLSFSALLRRRFHVLTPLIHQNLQNYFQILNTSYETSVIAFKTQGNLAGAVFTTFRRPWRRNSLSYFLIFGSAQLGKSLRCHSNRKSVKKILRKS